MKTMKYLAYFVAAIFVIAGIAFVAGYLTSAQVPSQLRVMIGIVLILYGGFRIVTTYFKRNESGE